jgi:hypothetical protein
MNLTMGERAKKKFVEETFYRWRRAKRISLFSLRSAKLFPAIYCESSVCGFCVCLLRRIFVDFSDLDGIRFLCKL